MITIQQYYDTHEEWCVPSSSMEAMDCIDGGKAMGCMGILVWQDGRIIYQTIRKDVWGEMCIKFVMKGFKLL
jgi:hypothetical protein